MEVEDLVAAMRTLLEATSWTDWWFYDAKPFSMRDTNKKTKVQCLFVTGTRMHLLVTKTALMICANSMLKQCDAVLGKVKDNISSDSFMDL